MNNKVLKNLIYVIVPLFILVVASITLVSTGVITFERIEKNTENITVTLNVDTGEDIFKYQIQTDNSTAFGVLEKARERTDLTFQADYNEKYQSHIINSINGVESTDTAYWIFYLNGEMASVGVDQQYIQDGDIINFKFEESPW